MGEWCDITLVCAKLQENWSCCMKFCIVLIIVFSAWFITTRFYLRFPQFLEGCLWRTRQLCFLHDIYSNSSWANDQNAPLPNSNISRRIPVSTQNSISIFNSVSLRSKIYVQWRFKCHQINKVYRCIPKGANLCWCLIDLVRHGAISTPRFSHQTAKASFAKVAMK